MAQLILKDWQSLVEHVERAIGSYDASHVFEFFRNELIQSVQDNFQGQHDPDGVPWQPRKRAYQHKPLRKTNTLYLSAIETVYHAIITKDSIDIETDLLPDYGLYHLFGTRKMPQRAFLGIPEKMVDRIEEALADDVQMALTGDVLRRQFFF